MAEAEYEPIPSTTDDTDAESQEGSTEGPIEEILVGGDQRPRGCIKDFKIEGSAGSGGFGKVYKATEKSTGDVYAIKECYKNKLLKMNIAYLAKRERCVMAELDHRFIVKLHSAFQDDKKLYFVLEYCPNGTLQDKLFKYGTFRIDVIRFYTAELIMALEYLRTLQIVHRDLKWSNILLDERFHTKLIDFGACVKIDPTEIGSRRQRARGFRQRNDPIGTPGMLAPEILNQLAPTYGTDLWCMGIMMYECHTGKIPFKLGTKHYGCMREAEYKRFPKGTDPALADLVHHLLVKDPKKRLGINDMSKLKAHPFYGSEEIRDWDKLHKIPAPAFKAPSDPDVEPFDMLPADVWDWNNLDTPPASPEPEKKKCIIM